MKNSHDTIGNRTRDLPACCTVPQPTACPLLYCGIILFQQNRPVIFMHVASCHMFKNSITTEIKLLHLQPPTQSHFHFLIIVECAMTCKHKLSCAHHDRHFGHKCSHKVLQMTWYIRFCTAYNLCTKNTRYSWLRMEGGLLLSSQLGSHKFSSS